ncbi:MAG: hypothetical protein KF685_01095 [Acidobacteria bacterium]|nr:hypothetical protein [Acidobacteriota bacterium]
MKSVRSVLFILLGIFIGLSNVDAQSTDQRYPTPITSDVVTGSISARAISDSRKTEYYYAFEGRQGDIFINVVYENLNGDIDVFVVDGLRLMTRIVALADHGMTETGRVVYLRKPEKLLLRVSGRTPNDDPARFTIKFAGSFLAVSEDLNRNVPELPKVSVPTTVPEKKEEVAKGESQPRLEVVVEEPVAAKAEEPQREVAAEKPPEVENTTPPTRPQTRSTASRQRRTPSRNTRAGSRPEPEPEKADAKQPETTTPRKEETPAEQKLVVIFRDGAKVDVSMNDVLRFSMDSGTLVIVQKNGRIRRFQMKDISKFSVE